MVTGMYSYETYASTKSSNNNDKTQKSNVGYFKLANDGDEAYVRFDYDDVNELVIAQVHEEPVGNNKHRRVLCLRGSVRDDMANCPFCARGDKFSRKVYLKLIEYVKDEQGKIVPQAKIWERPTSFADTIAEYINNYGGLKDVVFKIKRKGASMSPDTTYILTPMPSVAYDEAHGYIKDFHDFDNFNLYPHSFLSKTKEEIEEYIKTGDFPFHKKETNVTPNSQQTQQVPTQPKVGVQPKVQEQPKVEVQVTPQPTVQPSNTSTNPVMDRPRRRYDW